MEKATVNDHDTRVKKSIRTGAALAIIFVAGTMFWIASTSDSALIMSHFGIRIPANTTVVARRIDTFGFDGSVAWVIKLENHSEALGLVPKGFVELPPTTDSSSKYQEVLQHFQSQLNGDFSGFGEIRVFLGGPDGNSFIGVSKGQNWIMLLSFRT